MESVNIETARMRFDLTGPNRLANHFSTRILSENRFTLFG
ncbi:hypothetical protein CES85_0053 [Ochrobactrum quorumnocens]|jgi:hypothetical protein|uniref:Uncharacterized protein n=1 Tax=Ochrobactrum quorumnocens TaxID=271865 RepID=A0A248UF97_9HYPH|nr:hypothetical protein CES85_0053 [[Ochrobactrum] quorumnocens]MDH7790074.1 hypothetical protein [Ochrobactrum sp. AN78]